jgi:asparagine synthase (glutamine-hydrolysing)
VCGITGIYDSAGGPVEAGSIVRMCATVRHRGPDGEGVYASGHVGLGHTRLAIIDLSSAGDQPMANEDGTIVVVFNGEAYNFPQLRVELAARGHRFRSRTDTEVVVHGYEEWGEDVVHHLNGMFAFALWDAHQDRVVVARDRYGIKPLYYAVEGDRFVFASEIKALLQIYGWDRSVDLSALDEYFTFQNVLSDRTLFQGVRLLPAGHVGHVRRGSTRLVMRRFWDCRFAADDSSRMSFEEATVELRERMEHAVARHLISDVPVGSYLSGGMDSGSLVALASGSISHLMTFTGGFDVSLASGIEQNFDEREAAEGMSTLFRTDHYEMVMHAGSMERVLPRLIWQLEDLRVGMSYQNYYIAQLASRFVRVCLSGCGGDELFAGYPWRYLPLLTTSSRAQFDEASYRFWQRLVPEADKDAFYSEELRAGLAGHFTRDVFLSVLEPMDAGDDVWSPIAALNRELYLEMKTFLHGLLVLEDRISSAHALETRTPFLDNELVDFALSLPAQYKLNMPGLLGDGQSLPERLALQSRDGKHVLRAAMKGVLPDNILLKDKQGFSTPDDCWYRGASMAYIKSIILSPRAQGRGYFRPDYVGRIIDEHSRGVTNHRLLIWSLLSFEWWNRLFVDGDSLQDAGTWPGGHAADRRHA